MELQTIIKKSPLSEESKTLRRNFVLMSAVCIFVGLTGSVPDKVAVFGLDFNATQKDYVIWFMAAVEIYFLLHFYSIAVVEVTDWVGPFYEAVLYKRRMLKHPAFDETDFLDIGPPADPYNLDEYQDEARRDAKYKVQRAFRYFYSVIYIKLIIELIMPLVLSIWALYLLAKL